ncbi:hypothetical protein [Nonomuraea rubra]|uniref:Uncharacterized protein n=1 Tax=Nonomuraea rubra TaxID=46180 RepID=A0A7X0NZ31_9ACTN|nr:hypothetical protein [Nonomuraea rubra]MBB6552279.1 hypothetical protein [Nonomuraea rubra]
MTRRTRVLPALAAGSGEMAFVTRGWSETFGHDLTRSPPPARHRCDLRHFRS